MEVVTGPDNNQAETFTRFVEQYQTTLLRTCYLYLQDQEQAKDAVQETFLKAYKAMESFRGECSEKTWLLRIAMNTCRDMRRSAWFRFTDKRITPEQLPEAAQQPAEKDRELVMAVMSLPPKFKEVILLYYYQGMNSVEIARTLGLAQSTVSNRLKRARQRLRAVLEGGFSDE